MLSARFISFLRRDLQDGGVETKGVHQLTLFPSVRDFHGVNVNNPISQNHAHRSLAPDLDISSFCSDLA